MKPGFSHHIILNYLKIKLFTLLVSKNHNVSF